MHIPYKYRLYPNKTQQIALAAMMADFCLLYNAALEQRISAYKRRNVFLWYNNQALELKDVRRELPDLARWSFTAEQQVLRRLEKAFAAFFRRLKSGKPPGYPRFKKVDAYTSADFRLKDGVRICKSKKVGFKGVPGEIRVKWHRELPSEPATAVLSRRGSKWFVIFCVEVLPNSKCLNKDSVGIDLGLTNLVALSNGEVIPRPQWRNPVEKEMRTKNRALARCKKGSVRRIKQKARVTKLHARVAFRRRDYLHKLTTNLVSRFGRMAIEDLQVEGLSKNTWLAKHVRDASWGMLISMLRYKAERAGCELIEVNSRGTSQTCPECGQVEKKPLFTREHVCSCGCKMDRDVAAAKVIHSRAFGYGPGTDPQTLSQRSAA